MDYVPTGGPYARFLYNRAVDAVISTSVDWYPCPLFTTAHNPPPQSSQQLLRPWDAHAPHEQSELFDALETLAPAIERASL